MIHLTYDQALADLTAVVDQLGESYVYAAPVTGHDGITPITECAYFDPYTGEPSCGVGRVLARNGLSAADIGDLNVDTPLSDLTVVDLDPRAYRLLKVFQGDQDSRVPYGEALADAIAHSPDLTPA